MVEPKTLPATYEYVGQTTGSKEVEVRARVSGILERKLFEEGAPVKAGQSLFTIDPSRSKRGGRAEADIARAQAQKEQADREAARLKPLAERRRVGQKEADDAASNAELAAAAVKAAQAKLAEVQLSLGYTQRRRADLRPVEPRADPKAAWSPPTRRCSRRSRRSTRSGCLSRSPRTSS